MSSYWAAVGVILVPLGAGFKYLVWDFFHKVQSLDEQYSTRIAETHAAIHERKFLPIIASIYESVAARKAILPAASASTVEILTELSLNAKVKEAVLIVSEKITLDRSYRWARILSIWVAVPWFCCIVLFVVLFLRHYDAQIGVRSLWTPPLLLATSLFGGVGCFTLTLYRWALNRFIRLLGANPL